jgi:hypothetical protein
MIAEFKKGNVYLSKDYIHKLHDALENEDEEYVEGLLQEKKAEGLETNR